MPTTITNPVIFDFVPRVLGEACDGLAELSAHNGESVGDVVAFLVEGSSAEGVLRCAVEQLELFGFAECVQYELSMLSNSISEVYLEFEMSAKMRIF